MSYILDALRKAEQKRKLENIPELESAIARDGAANRRWPWGWLAVVAVIILSASTLFYFRQPLLERARTWVGGNDSDQVLSTTEQAATSAESAEASALSRQSAQQDPQPDRRDEQRKVPVERAGPRAPRQDSIPERREVRQPAPRQLAPKPAENQAVQPIAEPAPSEDASAINRSEEPLPAALQQKLDTVNLNVISFSSNPDKRFIMVGAQILREGDTLPGGILISQIRRREVLVEIDGREALLTP